MRKQDEFKTEAELCADFTVHAKKCGATVYAETHGWDLLVVNPDGVQIGIQAKLHFGVKVLSQAMDHWWNSLSEKSGPDYRAILLPRSSGAETLILALGLVEFFKSSYSRHGYNIDPVRIEDGRFTHHNWNPERRLTLPEYVPDVTGGHAAPIQLTKWKIGALKLTAILELRGYLTRTDFNAVGINPQRWIGPSGWLEIESRGRYRRGKDLNFDKQHPEVYEQVKNDMKQFVEGGLPLSKPTAVTSP